MKRDMFYITTLTIAGSDCSGGAGLQADLKTMSALGCYAASAVTAVTVQNTCGVKAIQAVAPEIVAGQIRAVMDDIRPKAVKIGMVNDRATIQAIADALSEYSLTHLIVDPVMVSTSGHSLMQPDALEVFVRRLLPMSTLLTPNIPEAEILAGLRIATANDADRAAGAIMLQGCPAVLIKGGHWEGNEKNDRLYTDGESLSFTGNAIQTNNTHGTGCTLSAAITAYLARGEKLVEAVASAKNYVSRALQAGSDVRIGNGKGPVNHFFNPEKLIKR